MAKLFVLSAGIVAFTAAPVHGDFPGSGPGGAIPDNDADGISSTIVLTGTAAITDLNVNVGGLFHSWMGDVRMTLEHVGFGQVAFVNQPGVAEMPDPAGSSSNFGSGFGIGANYTFDDEGADLWADVSTQSDDYFLPSGNWSHVAADDLSLFDGQPMGGAWILTISDNAGFDTGFFENWDLKISTPAPGALALLSVAGLLCTRRRRH